MRKFTWLLVLVCSISASVLAQSVTIDKWQVKDIAFNAKADKPFEVKFGAVFTGPGDLKLNIPGFYNGRNNQWVVRFSSAAGGDWSYTTYSTETGLAGKSGMLKVSQNHPKEEHGAVVIDDKNPQLFAYEDGTPYFLMAYEFDWLFAMDYGKEELATAKKLLHTIKERGFNAAGHECVCLRCCLEKR